MKKLFLAIILSLFTGLLFSSPKGRSYVLKSPDGRIVTEVRVAGGISFRVVLGSGSAGDAGVSDGRLIVASLPVSMVLGNGDVLGNNPTV
ncbi:MAG: hypothetical protein PHZ25_03210, partial [Candidatus Pacebacteria bacterium]|nr:hypothetical protein [Candidatus Paceibacterota bacterium]